MNQTFLDVLTRQNPVPTVPHSKIATGGSTKIKVVYGPHKTQPWTGINLQNLIQGFGDVLRSHVHVPKTRNKDEMDNEKLIIYEEGSVTSLCEDWNEDLVQHALDGTRITLMESNLKEHLEKGMLQFKKNNGQGHVADEKRNLQKPDWCVYQKGEGDNDRTRFPNLVPGDSKPASKWRSEWIDNKDETLDRCARLVVQQVTKYMWLSKTRYGFVISEEELVPMRLSTFRSGVETVDKHMGDIIAGQIIDSSRGNLEEDDQFEDDEEDYENDDDGEYQPDPEIKLEANQRLAAFLRKSSNTTRLLVEYCRIPWTNYGPETLTINLTLWWLPMLAVQDSSIKETGTYTPLSNAVQASPWRSGDQKANDKVVSESPGELAAASRKRKAENSDRPVTRSRSRQAPVNDRRGSRASASRRVSTPPEPSFRPDPGDKGHRTAQDPARTPGGMFSRASRGRRNKGKATPTNSFTSVTPVTSSSRASRGRKNRGNDTPTDSFTSIASTRNSSPATEDGIYAVSFALSQ